MVTIAQNICDQIIMSKNLNICDKLYDHKYSKFFNQIVILKNIVICDKIILLQ